MNVENVNVAGTDNAGRLQVFVANPKPINAIDRARLYEVAPDLLAACCKTIAESNNGTYLSKGALDALLVVIRKANQ